MLTTLELSNIIKIVVGFFSIYFFEKLVYNIKYKFIILFAVTVYISRHKIKVQIIYYFRFPVCG